jgi:uncharacterized protein
VKLVDLNVLLYAVNEDSPNHRQAHAWWEAAMNGEEAVGLAWSVVLGFLRLVTNPAIFPCPLAIDAALARTNGWLSHENVRVVRENDDHWELLRSLLARAGTAGNLTTDAHLAALAISHGAVLVSCDNDFARFEGLRRENPLATGNAGS